MRPDLYCNGTDMVSELALFEDKILGIRVKVLVRTPPDQRADGNAMTYNTVKRVFEKQEWSSAPKDPTSRRFNIPESISNGP
jgi:hypothetical protein